MDISAANFYTKTALTVLLELYSDPSTSLKPPMPTYPLDQFDCYIEDLNYSPTMLAGIPEEVKENFQKAIYVRKKDDLIDINEQSLKGLALRHLANFLNASEEKAKINVQRIYETSLDGPDRATLSQVFSVLKSVKDFLFSFMTKQGKFVGLVGKESYDKAKIFSYYESYYHLAKLSAYVHLMPRDLYFVVGKKEFIGQKVQEHLGEYAHWFYRWKLCEKVASLEFLLKGQAQHFQDQYDHSSTKPYELLAKMSDLSIALMGLKNGFFNHIVAIKPKSEQEQKTETYINQGVSWLNHLLAPVEKAPDFLETYERVTKLIQENYNGLKIEKPMKAEFSEILDHYVKSVSQDQFMAAKWDTLAYETVTPETPFNWLQEAGHFENYKRKVDRLFSMQDCLYDLIWEVVQKIDSKGEKNQEILMQIRDFYHLQNQLDSVRILMRLGFLKGIKTRVNQSNKGVWERLTQSLGNKALRLLLDGEVFDKTRPYEEVLRDYQSACSDFSRITSVEITEDQVDYYVFYDREDYLTYVRGQELKASQLKVIYYNLERIGQIKKDPFFEEHFKYMRILFDCSTHLSFLNDTIRDFKKVDSLIFEDRLLTDLSKLKRQTKLLSESFKKYVISDYNSKTPLTTNRVTESAVKKIDRYQKTGGIFDSSKSFVEIYPAFQKELLSLSKKMTKVILGYLDQNPIQKLALGIQERIIVFGEGGAPQKIPYISLLRKEIVPPSSDARASLKQITTEKKTPLTIIEDYAS